MKKLIIRALILFSPFLLILIFFVCADPMKIIRNYPAPVEKGVLMNDRLFQERYVRSHGGSYSSFILGSSRSKAFKTTAWKIYSGADSCFHLGVNDETIYGIERKLSYLDRKKIKIRNVLLVLDHRLLSLDKNPGAHIFREAPEVSGESNTGFYKRFMIGFFKPDFLKAYIDWRLHGEYKPWMKNYIFKEDFKYIVATGDINYVGYDEELKKDSAGYYSGKKEVFYERKEETLPPVLSEKGKQLLLQIREILKKNGSRYKIIITPNYDQKKLNVSDLAYLQSLFGNGHVYDYSGANEFTKKKSNYYEERHFKPFVANELMKEVYGKKKP